MSHCVSAEDVFVWPCGTWCFREEAAGMSHMSDDYRVLYVDTIEYFDFLYEEIEE